LNYFDSITLLLPNIPEQVVNQSKLYSSNETKTTFKLKKAHQVAGLNDFTYDAYRKEIHLSVSSKILGADYFRLLSNNTLPDLYSKLDALQLFAVDWHGLLNAIVLRFDVSVDCPCTDVPAVITSMQAYGSRLYRVTDPYRNQQGQKTSIEFHKNRKSASSKMRLIAYWKAEELSKNTGFVESLTQAEQSQLLTQAQNILRLESTFANFQKMRNYLKIRNNTLQAVTTSQANIIKTILNEIVMKSPISSNTKQPLNPSQVSTKDFYLYNTLAQYHFDLAAIRTALRAIDPRNLSRNMQAIEELYARLPVHDPAPVAKVLDYLQYCY
jgi:hypothetical protein